MTLTTQAKKKKVLWAIDPFDDHPELWKKAAQVMRELRGDFALGVDPVYLLAAEDVQASPARAEGAKALLTQLLKELEAETNPPRVIEQHGLSLQASVTSLLRGAKVLGSDLIVVGSHGRKGIARAVLGSFSEELILQSKVPVLVVSPHCDLSHPRSTEVLVPTDLSDPRAPFFSEAFEFARSAQADVRLLHAVPRHGEQLLRAGAQLFAGSGLPEPLPLAGEHEAIVEALKGVVSEFGKGLTSELVVDDVSPSVAQAIISHAREGRSRFIMMAAQSGPIAAALIGSVTREVIRGAHCPVIVCPKNGAKRSVTLI